jgi:hypothetical protein
VRARLRSIHRQTEPLVEFYGRRGVLAEIPGDGAVEAVREDVLSAVNALARPGLRRRASRIARGRAGPGRSPPRSCAPLPSLPEP